MLPSVEDVVDEVNVVELLAEDVVEVVASVADDVAAAAIVPVVDGFVGDVVVIGSVTFNI